MSFIQVETVRAIKLHGKTYRSAHQAAQAYTDSATRQFYFVHMKDKQSRPLTIWEYNDIVKPIKEKFYRRSHRIFTRYFSGKP